ncbi:TPA: hypothetical protein MHZ87_26640 [Klebsiella pneumoniae subsp. pneumoniae]|nr:hypothetical protein [Klebsiella pneumoniae subsp. pneumoniae]
MTGCWSGKVAGYCLNALIFMLFILIFNIIFVKRTKVVVAKLRCPSLLAIHGPLTSDVKTRRTSAISLTCSSEI